MICESLSYFTAQFRIFWGQGARLESLQNARDLSYIQIACTALFVSLNNSSIVSFCCYTKNFAAGTVAEVYSARQRNRWCKANFPVWSGCNISVCGGGARGR